LREGGVGPKERNSQRRHPHGEGAVACSSNIKCISSPHQESPLLKPTPPIWLRSCKSSPLGTDGRIVQLDEARHLASRKVTRSGDQPLTSPVIQISDETRSQTR